MVRMEHRCSRCASLQVARVREMAFAVEWRCLGCDTVFTTPRISVVLVDPVDDRRNVLVSCLEREGIPVLAAAHLAEIERWPIGKVLVTDVSSCPRFHTGAAHVLVIAASDEERAAVEISDGSAAVVRGEPATLIAALRGIAASNSLNPAASVRDRRST